MANKRRRARSAKTTQTVKQYTESVSFDRRLYRYDIAGSIAHAKMLAKCGIITRRDSDRIVKGLRDIRWEIETDTFPFKTDFEDIHMNIEARLIEKIGPVGGKLHTARSRNDQVALDIRLYARDEIDEIVQLIRSLQRSLMDAAEEYVETIMPGYTHLQHAQPVLLSHHLMAYYEMFQRDVQRLEQCRSRTNISPLGAGALAGTSHPIDREFVARELGFAAAAKNSIDAVSDRDFLVELAADCAIIMMHLSRLCEELVLWSSSEFGFAEIPEPFSTGSSIMPQKRNPDVAELTRGKTGRVYGDLMALLTTMKSLPLSYNRDMQEDKETIFDAVDTVKTALSACSEMMKAITFNEERLRQACEEGFLCATDVADYLVQKGMPFREAHKTVSELVTYAAKKGKSLADMSLDELRQFSELFDGGVRKCLSPESAVRARTSAGGSAPAAVRKALRQARRQLGNP